MIKNDIIENKLFKVEVRTMLSLLWLFYILNVVFRDIHEFIKADFLKEVLTGTIGGYQVTEGLLFIGGIVAVITISMVLLSATLKKKPNIYLNLIFSPLFALSIITNRFGDPDDLLHLIFELLAVISIFVIALRWKKSLPTKTNK